MKKRFVELVCAFLNEAKISCPVQPGDAKVTVPVGAKSFDIDLLEDRHCAVLQTTVGVLPETLREAFFVELLRMNSLFLGSKGSCIGVQGNMVTLQSFVNLDHLTHEQFNLKVIGFVEAFAHVLKDYESIAKRAKENVEQRLQQQEINTMNMIPV